MQVKCILFPLDWVINKSYSFKSEWKETVEKKDLLGAEGGRPDLILSPTFSFSWSKPSIGDQLRPWWILFNFVLQHKSIGTKTVYQMETFQSLSFHRNQKWKQLNTPDIRRRDRATKLQEYFATQLHKLLDVWSFFFFPPQYLGWLPPQPQIPGLLSSSGETSQFNSFSESMPGLRAASHRWWAAKCFYFHKPFPQQQQQIWNYIWGLNWYKDKYNPGWVSLLYIYYHIHSKFKHFIGSLKVLHACQY